MRNQSRWDNLLGTKAEAEAGIILGSEIGTEPSITFPPPHHSLVDKKNSQGK